MFGEKKVIWRGKGCWTWSAGALESPGEDKPIIDTSRLFVVGFFLSLSSSVDCTDEPIQQWSSTTHYYLLLLVISHLRWECEIRVFAHSINSPPPPSNQRVIRPVWLLTRSSVDNTFMCLFYFRRCRRTSNCLKSTKNTHQIMPACTYSTATPSPSIVSTSRLSVYSPIRWSAFDIVRLPKCLMFAFAGNNIVFLFH